jgi:cytochrome c553
MSKLTPLVLLSGCLLLAGPLHAADPAAGKTKAADVCADCHGMDGKDDKDFPIAGMAPEAFTKAMKEYQSGVRTKSKKMTKSASKVNDEDIADLAAYYGALPK